MNNSKEIDWKERCYEIANAMMPQVTVLVTDVLNRGQRIEGEKRPPIYKIHISLFNTFCSSFILF